MTDGQRPLGRLMVAADLRLDVDGVGATVTGNGSTLIVASDEPVKLWQAANSSALPDGVGRIGGPRAIGRLADALDRVGLQLEVVGPDGPLVRLGARASAGASSRSARLLIGSDAVSFGSARALLPPVVAAARSAVNPRVVLVGAAAVALGVLTVLRRRRSG